MAKMTEIPKRYNSCKKNSRKMYCETLSKFSVAGKKIKNANLQMRMIDRINLKRVFD